MSELDNIPTRTWEVVLALVMPGGIWKEVTMEVSDDDMANQSYLRDDDDPDEGELMEYASNVLLKAGEHTGHIAVAVMSWWETTNWTIEVTA